jgi:nucleotidyltransferase substrate binding protein (TIGR01987 family)
MGDIRWKQRYSNYTGILKLLRNNLYDNSPGDFNELEQIGLAKGYELCFELLWKLLKDYLTVQGFAVNSPREVIKQSFALGIIENGELWLEMLDARNHISHIYESTMALEIFKKIKNAYISALTFLTGLAC